jgi:hypothetical protein
MLQFHAGAHALPCNSLPAHLIVVDSASPFSSKVKNSRGLETGSIPKCADQNAMYNLGIVSFWKKVCKEPLRASLGPSKKFFSVTQQGRTG